MQAFILFLQSHQQLSVTFAVLLTLLIVVEFIRQKRATYLINPQQLTQKLNHENAKVFDLRSPEEFKKGHIIDSTSIPASEFAQSKKIDKTKGPYVLVCAKGTESLKLANQLKSQGWNVYVLGGGISSWINAELPLVKD